jgi:sterol 3beta-glucosyltransferase
MHITILTVGSRGDVQPYLALGRGLKAAGHRVRFATELNYRDWIENEGFDYAPLYGDTKARITSEKWLHFWESNRHRPFIASYRCNKIFVLPTLNESLDSAWQACQGTDLIIGLPSVFGCSHIAEKLGIPFFQVWTSPFTSTREFAHSWSQLPKQRWLGGKINQLSYWILGAAFILPLGNAIDQWRQNSLGLASFRKKGAKSQPTPLILYAFSPSIVPKPVDWDETIHITGYWFLNRSTSFQASADLDRFIKAGYPPIYIGFGSISDRNRINAVRLAIDAAVQNRQRVIVECDSATLGDTSLSSTVFRLDPGVVPHVWLFPKMSALIHHGGASTTGEGLRAGKPSMVIYQKFTDYYFWAQRVAELGVGPAPIGLENLTVKGLASAIETMMTDRQMQERAAQLGQEIRAEDGVAQAIAMIHQQLSPALQTKQPA